VNAAADAKRLQFGQARPGETYRDRPAAFGVVVRAGLIATVRIEKPGEPPFWDLPGGAIDPGESEADAVVREFVEETGLRIAPGEVFARAAQFIAKHDERMNNLCVFFTGAVTAGEPEGKIEHDHHLEWNTPLDLIGRLRHDAHAWAVAAWMRRPH
jgi:8-oxo-dGTP diphosphatase